MQEERLILNTPDGKRIYGALTQQTARQSDKLLITLHGLGRNAIYDALHVCARDYFVEVGYDVCRFNFYDARFKARQLHETSLETHLTDFCQVLKEVASDYDEVYLAGHSYGGLLTLIQNAEEGGLPSNIKAIALWDAGHGLGDRLAVIDGRMAKAYPEYDLYGYDYGVKLMVPSHFMEERKHFTVDYCNTLATKCTIPTLVIAASESFLIEGAEEYHAHLAGEKSYKLIQGAAHFFAEGDTAQQVYAATDTFFNTQQKEST